MWTLTGRLYDVYITDIVYLLDVLVVIVAYSLYVLLQLLGLFIIARELGRVFWRLGGGVQVGGGVEYLTEKNFSLRNVPGVLKRKKKKRMQTKIYFSGGGEEKKNKNSDKTIRHSRLAAGNA